MPESGPLLILSATTTATGSPIDGRATRRCERRQIRALAKSDLWKVRGLGPVLNGMGRSSNRARQRPISRRWRGRLETLRAGACIGVFPEGTRSRGKVLRGAGAGSGRLALEVPEAHITLVAMEETRSLTGFPRRSRIRGTLLQPGGRSAATGRGPRRLLGQGLAEIRELVPPVISYRKRGAPLSD